MAMLSTNKTSKKPNYEQPETIIGKDTVIEMANLNSKTSIQINGIINGNVNIESSLVIGQTGKITGNVTSEFVLVAGTVEGDILVKQQLHVNKTAEIKGNIQCKSIVIDEGAKINGQISMDQTSVPQITANKSLEDKSKK